MWAATLFEGPVIPAKAGIQSPDSGFPKVGQVDSRFRGNDCDLHRPALAAGEKMRCFRAGGEIFLDSNSTGLYYQRNAGKEVIHVDRKLP